MKSTRNAGHASTANVARALGVSVSTVKRWVDDGILPAHKTAGGHRKLLIADVLELARRTDLPHADLSLLAEEGGGLTPVSEGDLATQLQRALITGDSDKVRVLILGTYRAGKSVAEIADSAVGPAMAAIGQEWEAGKIDIMEEHRASQLCASVLYELKARLETRAERNRPRAVGAAPEDDYSVLPTLLAQMTLLDVGWEAINLGPDTPFPSLTHAVVELRPRLVWVSVSHSGPEDAFITSYCRFYQHAELAGVPVAIGGYGLKEGMRSRIPYTTYGDRLSHLAAFARTLNPRPARPERGRPKSR